MKNRTVVGICLAFGLVLMASAAFSAPPLRIYLDADMSTAKASATSIERGIRVALAEVGNVLSGRPVELVLLDHRGNAARSLGNMKRFLQDPDALVLFAGQHSPPLLAHRDYINENGVLILDPWAAAGPITRPSGDTNWIFRLSVDDSKAGEVIVRRAVDARRFKKPALLLERTGWGKSNLKTMTRSLESRGVRATHVAWFDWGLRETGAKMLLREIKQSEADIIFLVANAPEGKAISKAMHDLPASERLPVVSHWGITGGDFPEVVNAEMRKELDLEFLQTSFSFLDMGDSPFPNHVFNEARRLFPEIQRPEDIKAPTGFIHAYDLTRLLVAAVEGIRVIGDIRNVRVQLRDELEKLSVPVPGLIKVYEMPFRPYTVDDPDAHEALDMEDFTFGRYGDGNEIILVR